MHNVQKIKMYSHSININQIERPENFPDHFKQSLYDDLHTRGL